MSSYNQIIINEIMLRAPNNEQITIIFEPRAHVFPYGKPRISVQPTVTRETASTGGFVRFVLPN